MYHIQTNKIALRSQNMIADALMNLMKRKAFHEITITEICAEADIGRKTFYRNFELKEDVIDFRIDDLCREYEKEIMGKPADDQLYLYFAFSKKNVEFFSVLYRNGLLPVCQKKFARLLPAAMPVWTEDPLEQEYRSRFVTAGIQAIMQLWVEHSFEEDIEKVVSMARGVSGGN